MRLRTSAEVFSEEATKTRCVMYGRGRLPLRVAFRSKLRLEREAGEACGSQRAWVIKQDRTHACTQKSHLELAIAYVAPAPRCLCADPGCPGKAPEARGGTRGHGHAHTHTSPSLGRQGRAPPVLHRPAPKEQRGKTRAAHAAHGSENPWGHTNKSSCGISALPRAAELPPRTPHLAAVISSTCLPPAALPSPAEAVARGCSAPGTPLQAPRAPGTA